MRVFTLLALLALATAAAAVDYWPDVIGSTFTFVDGIGEIKTVAIEPGQVGGDVRYDWYSHDEGQNCVGYEEYVFDSGTASCVALMQSCEGWEQDDIRSLAPGILYVNDTMNVGDTWTVVTQATIPVTVELTYVMTVVAAETITVPAGTFDTLKLTVYHAQGLWTRTYWLDSDLGPVKTDLWELESWTGIVTNESLGWGALKSLYN